MKTAGRILIIIVAALVIVGATFAVVRYGNFQGLAFEGGRDSPLGRGDTNQFEGSDSFPGEPGRDGGFFGIGTLLKDLLIVGILILAVVGLTKVFDSARHMLRRTPSSSPLPPTPPPAPSA